MNATAPLLHAYRAAGAVIAAVGGMETGTALGAAPGALYVADLTPLRKLLLVGGGAHDALTGAGLDVPALMRIGPLAGGGYMACRAPRQYLVSAGDGADLSATLRGAACALTYDSVDFALGGGSGTQDVEDLLAEGCPTDLAQFDATCWIPTQLFGVEVGLWRPRAGHYRVLAAPADGEFLGACVLDAVRRRHGELAGYDDYFAIQRTAAGG